MLRSWIVQLCIVVFLWIVLTMFKNRFKNIWPRRLKKLDVLCIFLIIAIHFTSIELIGISLFPYLVFVMSVVGLIMIFASAYRSGDIVYGVHSGSAGRRHPLGGDRGAYALLRGQAGHHRHPGGQGAGVSAGDD